MKTQTSHAQEVLEVSPKSSACGQKLTIKAGMLDKVKAYTLAVECSDFACTNPPGFKPLAYQIPLGSVSYVKDESFNINSKCPTAQVKAPAGAYTVKLIEGTAKTTVATESFDLEDKTPTACQLTIDPVLETTQNTSYTIQGKAGCKYKVSIISPTGTRQLIEEVTLPGAGTYNGILNKTLITTKGNYSIAGIADPTCTDLSVDDRECSSATTKVIDGTCTYSPQDKKFNCQQCAKGKLCSVSGTCVTDSVGSCIPQKPTEPQTDADDTDISKVKNSNTNIFSRLRTASTSSLIGIFIGMAIFGFMGYKVLAYRLRKD